MHESRAGWLRSRLYPILDPSFPQAQSLGPAIESLARAGCRLVQLRAKNLTSRAFCDWAGEAVQVAKHFDVLVLINDRADVALAVGAAGVHLGQDDLSPSGARKVLGPEAIIGYSTHSVEQAREANRLSVDYVAIGPVFATPTKPSGYSPLGPQGVAEARKVVEKPLVAIGGITRDNGLTVIEAGADSLAVISALFATSDLESAAREMLDRWSAPG